MFRWVQISYEQANMLLRGDPCGQMLLSILMKDWLLLIKVACLLNIGSPEKYLPQLFKSFQIASACFQKAETPALDDAAHDLHIHRTQVSCQLHLTCWSGLKIGAVSSCCLTVNALVSGVWTTTKASNTGFVWTQQRMACSIDIQLAAGSS